MDRDKMNLLDSKLNSGMDIFDLNYNHTSIEPEDVAIFIDYIGATDIESGSM